MHTAASTASHGGQTARAAKHQGSRRPHRQQRLHNWQMERRLRGSTGRFGSRKPRCAPEIAAQPADRAGGATVHWLVTPADVCRRPQRLPYGERGPTARAARYGRQKAARADATARAAKRGRQTPPVEAASQASEAAQLADGAAAATIEWPFGSRIPPTAAKIAAQPANRPAPPNVHWLFTPSKRTSARGNPDARDWPIQRGSSDGPG
jgi:hypothetical protein